MPRKIDQQARARDAWPLLVERARKKYPPFTYQELCDELGLHWRAAAALLYVIQRYCDENGLPKLQGLAVNAVTRLPGQGYSGPRSRAEHDRDLERVYRHNWPSEAPF